MKHINLKYWLVLFSFFLLFWPGESLCNAPNDAKQYYDNGKIDLRQPAPHYMDKYKTDRAFDYKEVPEGESIFSKIMGWFEKYLHVPKSRYAQNFLTTYMWYILFGVCLVFAIYMISKNEIKGLFGRKSKSAAIKISTIEEDINTLDFAKLIDEAISKRQYRYALRLFYLKALKDLSERQMIDWKLDKTNRDYLFELSSTKHYKPFEALTDMFNRIWYGDFPVDETYFNFARNEFSLFQQQLQSVNA